MVRPAIHLGEILADELQAIGISATDLARQLLLLTELPKSLTANEQLRQIQLCD